MFLVVKRKSLIVVAALTLVFVVALAALGASGTAAVFFGESTRKIPVYRVARAEDTDKVIALTFDAAWGADKTQGIIDILNEYDADATFSSWGSGLTSTKKKSKP